jgi:hypothetical protein
MNNVLCFQIDEDVKVEVEQWQLHHFATTPLRF